ncbi:MAG TPA: hypothetical protein VES66_09505 [Terriglobales bacterium]|nr:hypothetical protein [Terriglobales bacterium]
MNKRSWRVLAGLCALAMAAVWAAPACAQMSEVKEKPPMYSYVGNWSIPRAQWADMEKATAADRKILEKAVSDGTIVAYGNDVNLVHQADGETHDDWWSAMSMAGVLNVLDQFYKSGSSVSPVLASATKHWDSIYVSRYYNWHSGSWKDAYTHGSSYKLKPDAPDDAVEKLSKNLIVPLMEKLLTAGTIHEYEIDTEAIHTEAPGTFWIFYIAANAEGLDKVNAALRETMKANPLGGPAFASMVDFTAHRDYLARTNATYK